MLPPELQEIVVASAKKFDQKLAAYEGLGSAGGGLVEAIVKYPGTVTKVNINVDLTEFRKELLEDLIVTAVERAFVSMDGYVKDLTKSMANEIKDLVKDYIDTHPKDKPETDDDDDILN
jgi:DNA-binding protein YbaB